MLFYKSKLFRIPIQHHKIDYVFSYWQSQTTKVNGVCSLSLDITSSIVQESSIGPRAFINYVIDFKTLGYCNRFEIC